MAGERLRVLGYFPGTNLDDESQYGRQIHVYKFVERLAARDDVHSTVFLGEDGGQFPDADVRSVRTEGFVLFRLLYELWRTLVLVTLIRRTSLPVVVYARESPHFAPVVACALTDAKLVVESNGIPRNVRDSVDSRLQYYTLTYVRVLKWERADRIIAVSEGIAEFLRENYDVPSITVIENGVDADLFACTREVADEPPYTIGYVGGLQPYQRIETMIAVVAELDVDAEFLVVGGQPDRRAAMEAVAADLGIEDDVTFVGRVPHGAVPEYINRADLCFGPFAPDRSASPLKIYEYLACGREVVAVNERGLEFLDDYPGFHRLDDADPSILAGEVDGVLADVETNEAGAEHVREERSWAAVVDEAIEVCADTAESRTG